MDARARAAGLGHDPEQSRHCVMEARRARERHGKARGGGRGLSRGAEIVPRQPRHSDRLAKADPGNAGWQRDLSVSYNKIGEVLVAQGNLPEALKSFRDSLAIRDRLAKADPGNAGWQRDLSVSYAKLANAYRTAGQLPQAREQLTAGRTIIARLTETYPDWSQWKKDLAWFDGQIAALSK